MADGTSRAIRGRVATRTIRFDLAGADPVRLAGMPGVTEVDIRLGSVRLASTDADRTVRQLFLAELPIHDLEVTGADLEDAFVALTSDGADTTETV